MQGKSEQYACLPKIVAMQGNVSNPVTSTDAGCPGKGAPYAPGTPHRLSGAMWLASHLQLKLSFKFLTFYTVS